MLRLTELKLPLDHDEGALRAAVLHRLALAPDDLISFRIWRRSWDARKRSDIQLIYTIDVEVRNDQAILKRFKGDHNIGPAPDTTYKPVAKAPAAMTSRPIVIGTGPCGFFAALGSRADGLPADHPRARQGRTRAHQGHVGPLAPQRAATPSPTSSSARAAPARSPTASCTARSRTRSTYGRKVLTEFVKAGAPDEILYVSQAAYRHVSARHDGRERCARRSSRWAANIRFESTRRRPRDRRDDGARCAASCWHDGEHIATDHVVLAVGHSARDTFEMLHARGVYIEAKPFSIGFRIEHPQSLIDRAASAPMPGNPLLGAADYRLVHHCRNGRSVYSFCMCPGRYGGRRDLRAGPRRHQRHEPVFARRAQRQRRHRRRHHAGGRLSRPPARRHRTSSATGNRGPSSWAAATTTRRPAASATSSPAGHRPSFGKVIPSYTPGVHLCDLAACLPDYAIEAMREALPAFDRADPRLRPCPTRC